MSVFISESDDIKGKFKALREGIDIIENGIDNEIMALTKQIDICVIQNYKDIFIDRVNVQFREESSGYGYNKRNIVISIPSEFFKSLQLQLSDNTKYTKTIKGFGNNSAEFFGYKIETGYSSNSVLKIPFILESDVESEFKVIEIIDEIYNIVKPYHEENLKVKENNVATKTALFNLLERVGIKKEYYGKKTSRSTKNEKMYYAWSQEISTQTKILYDEKLLDNSKTKLIKLATDIYNIEKNRIKKENYINEQNKKKKEGSKKLLLLLTKYELDINEVDDWGSLLDVILDKNKYLRLAHYLLKNREDWNDGCSLAESGLSTFSMETPLDEDIYDTLFGYCENWDGDGRIFRDCKYNYDFIFTLAAESNPDLYNDYSIVMEYIED